VRLRPLLFPLGWFCCLFGAALGVDAASASWPSVVGELQGRLKSLPEAPALQWTLGVTARETGPLVCTVRVMGEGTAVEAECELSATDGVIRWRLRQAELDLARWQAALAAKFPQLAGINLGGILQAHGEGEWREGQVNGRMWLALADGRVAMPAKKFSLEGIACALQIDDLAKRRTAVAQVVTWQRGAFDVITYDPGRIVFSLDGETIRIDEASLGVLGGRLILAPFVFRVVDPEVTMAARAELIEVKLLLPLLPPMIAEAQGRLNGELTLHRDATGVQIRAGHLGLPAGEMADLRLLPTPGIFTSRLPPFIVKNFYPWLRQIENGTIPLRAHRMDVNFTPTLDAEGRSATVHIEGGPPTHPTKAPLRLDLNVHGPLEPLVKFGTDSRLRFGGKP
jgi:hypothetical protein